MQFLAYREKMFRLVQVIVYDFQYNLKTLRVSEGRVRFEDFERLTSACFSKLHEKPYY
jgi:hypothetical protein